ncbi:uncharacterized protein LOC128257396 [Drosophila gunungcola]|uniref:Uncharacterized protein n=1 Tax=Drosophila gunungcola TaxID=103775 RepID=A0A9Q0BRL6_9MUSC|nr:uncharacterized protein LOC128257396 [Drosophila gunungcola]KAI8041345.1 hypothetical protein M5D96_005603 [Drosophila gunungcola]
MSLDYKNWLLQRLAAFYHSIYFYVSLFSMAYCLALYQARERIYQMELSWARISLVYSCAGILALMLALVAYYAWRAMCLVWRQYCTHNRATHRTRFLFNLYRMQQVGASK